MAFDPRCACNGWVAAENAAGSGFVHLAHSDWSIRPPGRWVAEAQLNQGVWHVGSPGRVGPLTDFVDRLLRLAAEGPTLAGFDFPLGLPAAYAAKTDLGDFKSALPVFGTGEWHAFFDVAEHEGDIVLGRPFYPARPGGTSRAHLLAGHQAGHIDALTRRCERGGPGLKAAGCMFWTLGANQVGKAALDGWRHVIRPAVLRGASLWPFDGDLPDLAERGGLTLAETYPADAYGQIGLSLQGRSKRRQSDRAGLAPSILAWARHYGIVLEDAAVAMLIAGFSREDGEDNAFDAMVGLLAMIAVVTGIRADGAPADDAIRRWEGWILGRGARAG